MPSGTAFRSILQITLILAILASTLLSIFLVMDIVDNEELRALLGKSLALVVIFGVSATLIMLVLGMKKDR